MTGVVIGWLSVAAGFVSTVALWGAVCVMVYQDRPAGDLVIRMLFALMVTMAFAFGAGRLSVLGL